MLAKRSVIGCVIQCRVSSTKQSQEGESLEVQEATLRAFAANRGWTIYPDGKIWGTAISGRKTYRDDFEQILAFVKANPGLISYYVFRSIDRFTRAGGGEYERMTKELARYGVETMDTYGVIQPTKNTLEELGIEYEWSRFSPSELTEQVMATNAKQEITSILTRMIGQQIRLTQQGYRTRRAADGYRNKRVFVEGKKKVIQEADPERAKYKVAMFQLRIQGLSDADIVKRINAMGYHSPIFDRWNKEKTKLIGKRGGTPYTIKQLQRDIQNPIYAGVVCEKWTLFEPVKAQYPGLVDIETFNQANKGKVAIFEKADGELEIVHGTPSNLSKPKNKYNPMFPLKFLLCPTCSKPFLGSCPRGKLGKTHPTYHCSRGHKYFGVRKKDFEAAVQEYVSNLRFNQDILNGLEITFMSKYRQREKEIVHVSGDIHRNIADLETEQAAKLAAIVASTSPVVREMLEREIEDLESKIKLAGKERLKIQITRDDIKSFVREARYVMEHPAEMLLNAANPRAQEALFGLVFDGMPNYAEVLNGTPRLSYIFELSSDFRTSKNLLVTPRGIEPRFPA